MLEGTDPRLLLEWQAYYSLEPFGEERADIRNAITCSTIAGALMKKKGGGDFKLKDFMPEFDKEPVPQAARMKMVQSILKKRYGNNSKSGS